MILGENIGSVYGSGRGIQRVYSYGKLVWEKQGGGEDVTDYSVIPFTVKAVEKTSVYFRTKGYNYCWYFKYSINGGEWIENNGDIYSIGLNKGDTVSIISTIQDLYYCHISSLADVYGNIMSLIYGDDFIGKTTWERNYSVSPTSSANMIGFFTESEIRSAENLILPATTLADHSYDRMFKNCTSLTIAPKKLPATKLSNSCYSYMYQGCINLTTASELPATQLVKYCYHAMFQGCESLTIAPELPATKLPYYTYQYMFGGCKSLKYIKCYLQETTAVPSGYTDDDYFAGFIPSSSPSGTLVCYESFVDRLSPYIPEGWTVEYI